MTNNLMFWVIFATVATIIIIVDLYFTDHRRGKIKLKHSLIWSGVWIFTALLFMVFIYFYLDDGHQKALEFFTGYIVEYSLSVDNLFVFLMIFRVMDVPAISQPHVLKWGILSAIVFRIVFILAGVGLINLFHPIIYVFGLILILAAYKMSFGGDHPIDYENNLLVKFVQKFFNVTHQFEGNKFFVRRKGKLVATSLFLTLLVIESSDIVFAVDSIPAIIAITSDPLIIITSNIFAILGLRSLYFALAGIVEIFVYLKYGVSVVLAYVGVKMLISDLYKIPTEISLIFIIVCLGGSVILSLSHRKKALEQLRKDELKMKK